MVGRLCMVVLEESLSTIDVIGELAAKLWSTLEIVEGVHSQAYTNVTFL